MMKRDNLQRFIEATRVELNSMWDKCMYGKSQKKEFAPAFIGESYKTILREMSTLGHPLKAPFI